MITLPSVGLVVGTRAERRTVTGYRKWMRGIAAKPLRRRTELERSRPPLFSGGRFGSEANEPAIGFADDFRAYA